MSDKTQEQISTFLAVICVATLFWVLFTWPLEWNWNFLVPDLFGGPRINWTQAFLLQLLVRFFWPHKFKQT